jgi:aquaporin Z
MDKHLRPAVIELIGTFALVFLGAGTVCVTHLLAAPNPIQIQSNLVAVALAQGFILAALLSTTVPVSGGYLNPAVALMLWVFRRLEGRRVLWLIGAQLIGALAAGFFVRVLFTDEVLNAARCGTPHLNMDAFAVSGRHNFLRAVSSGIAIELVLTFLLTFAIFGTILDPRAPRLGGLGVGLTLVALVLFGETLTGAAVNPARWLGPALWELSVPGREGEALTDHMVYWVGPVFGALLAGAVYEFVLLPAVPPGSETPDTK